MCFNNKCFTNNILLTGNLQQQRLGNLSSESQAMLTSLFKCNKPKTRKKI